MRGGLKRTRYRLLACLLAASLLLGGCGAVRPQSGHSAPVPVEGPGGNAGAGAVSAEAAETAAVPEIRESSAETLPKTEAAYFETVPETAAFAAVIQGPGAAPVEVPTQASAETERVPSEAASSEAVPSEILPSEAVPPETVPAASLTPAREFAEEDFHFFPAGSGERIDGKINVEFFPDQYGSDGKPDPNVRVWDSCEITHPDEIRAVCERILASPLYDFEVYGRTLDSMVTEWQAHNDVNRLYPNDRTRHADFNRADEGLSYADFWQRAVRDYIDARRP